MFEVAEGYRIENGRRGERVRGATITGNGPEALSMIDMVGSDLGFGLGTCGTGTWRVAASCQTA